MDENDVLREKICSLEAEVESLKGQLEKQEKLSSLGLLSAGIAHEVQNPLNFVINFSKMSASLLKDVEEIISDNSEKMDEDDVADLEDISKDLNENLDKIREHGERAISIIRGILLQSRGKEGEFLPTDVPSVVHEYVWLSYHAMRANDKSFNVSIHEDYPENMPRLMLVPQDISRAVVNVMNNAYYTVGERSSKGEADYTPAVEVLVSYKELDGNSAELRIDMSDNGMGMTEEVRSKVFDNFFSTKPAGKGTGLGMGIMRKIVTEEHKGQLFLESESGKGTKISFVIPAKIVR